MHLLQQAPCHERDQTRGCLHGLHQVGQAATKHCAAASGQKENDAPLPSTSASRASASKNTAELRQMENDAPLPSTSASRASASLAGSSSMSRSCSSFA